MDKINFVNKGQPAINDTNLNKMQSNIEDAIEKVEKKGTWVQLADTTSDTETTKTVNNLNNYRSIALQVQAVSGQVLATTIGTLEQFKLGQSWQAAFGKEPDNYNAHCTYLTDTSIKISSSSQYDKATLFGII